MISPRKPVKYKKIKKLLPTLRYNDKLNLKSWSIWRDICVDYGKRYWIRTQANLTCVIIYSFYPIGYMVYHLVFENKESDVIKIVSIITIICNSILIWIAVFIFLYYSA